MCINTAFIKSLYFRPINKFNLLIKTKSPCFCQTLLSLIRHKAINIVAFSKFFALDCSPSAKHEPMDTLLSQALHTQILKFLGFFLTLSLVHQGEVTKGQFNIFIISDCSIQMIEPELLVQSNPMILKNFFSTCCDNSSSYAVPF